jgi:hypothetical protein
LKKSNNDVCLADAFLGCWDSYNCCTVIQCVPKSWWGFKIYVLNEMWYIHQTWIKLKNNSNSYIHMFVEVLCGLHWWLCKHLSSIPFPATLDREHQEWQMRQLTWFVVSSVVNSNTVDDLLHIPPEIKIQGCQVQRAWGPLLTSGPPNPAPWKCLIKKFRKNIGIVCRRTILLFSRTMALGSTQSLIEISTRNLPGGKGRPARKADNLTAICEPIV